MCLDTEPKLATDLASRKEDRQIVDHIDLVSLNKIDNPQGVAGTVNEVRDDEKKCFVKSITLCEV